MDKDPDAQEPHTRDYRLWELYAGPGAFADRGRLFLRGRSTQAFCSYTVRGGRLPEAGHGLCGGNNATMWLTILDIPTAHGFAHSLDRC